MIFTISILACLLRKNFACLAWKCFEMILNPKGRMAQFQNSKIFHKSRQGCVSVCSVERMKIYIKIIYRLSFFIKT